MFFFFKESYEAFLSTLRGRLPTSGEASTVTTNTFGDGNAGQITVTAPALAPVPTLSMADNGQISVATSGAGSAGSVLLIGPEYAGDDRY